MSGHLGSPTRGLQRAPCPLAEHLRGRRAEVTLLVKKGAETKTPRLLVSSSVIFFLLFHQHFTNAFFFSSFLSSSLPSLSARSPPHRTPHPPAPHPCPPSLFTTRREPSTCQVLPGVYLLSPICRQPRGGISGRAAIGEAVSGEPEGRSSGGALVSHAPRRSVSTLPVSLPGGQLPITAGLPGPFQGLGQEGSPEGWIRPRSAGFSTASLRGNKHRPA